jgi:hypothetical protein
MLPFGLALDRVGRQFVDQDSDGPSGPLRCCHRFASLFGRIMCSSGFSLAKQYRSGSIASRCAAN